MQGFCPLFNLEAVLWWEVPITIVSTIVISIGAVASVLYMEVVLWWEGPLYIGGFTVFVTVGL